MTIRSRMTLWYSGMLFASTLLISALAYRELSIERAGAKWGSHDEEEKEEQGDIVKIILWCGIPAALMGTAGGWWLMRQAMSPIAMLTRTAASIHEGHFGKQLPRTCNGDEIDQLTEVFNAMTSRLDSSFNRIREFTLHASHELKTPLTVLRGELEIALEEESSTPCRERLLSHLDEIQRLTKIVDGLTLLTKADAGQIELSRDLIRLDELVRDGFADAQILAQPHHVNVELSDCQEITLTGDRHRLRQMLLNLTDNAVKYNVPGGRVVMSLVCAGGFAELRLTNTGPGIPPKLQPRVFDHFFRCDSSHSNSPEGCGLGLSIVKWVVNAHGGTIYLTSLPDPLTTFTVRLPFAANVRRLESSRSARRE